MPVTFDGTNLRITLPTSTPTIDVQVDLYSEWKVWFKTPGNEIYPLAFDTTGGDEIGPSLEVAPYFFLRNDNGWRIRPAEEDAEITFNGNLYKRVGTLGMMVPTIGAFTVLATIELSSSSQFIDQPNALTRNQFVALK
jgi:hypothetical protein